MWKLENEIRKTHNEKRVRLKTQLENTEIEEDIITTAKLLAFE